MISALSAKIINFKILHVHYLSFDVAEFSLSMLIFSFIRYITCVKVIQLKRAKYKLCQGRGYPFRRDNSIIFFFYFPSEKGSTQKGKNLLPVGAISFLLV